MILNNDNGLLVKEIRKFLESCDEEGEVWIETGKGLTSPVTTVVTLNRCDVCFESKAFEKMDNENINIKNLIKPPNTHCE